jgi:hypothetical protein
VQGLATVSGVSSVIGAGSLMLTGDTPIFGSTLTLLLGSGSANLSGSAATLVIGRLSQAAPLSVRGVGTAMTSMHLAMAAGTPVLATATCPLLLEAATNPHSSLSLSLEGALARPTGMLNLVMPVLNRGSTTQVLNLMIQSGGSPLITSLPLYLHTPPPFQRTLSLTVTGAGQHAGYFPLETSPHLSVSRGNSGGITLFLSRADQEAGISLMITGIPTRSASVPLQILGQGGVLMSSQPLLLPAVVTPILRTGQIALIQTGQAAQQINLTSLIIRGY